MVEYGTRFLVSAIRKLMDGNIFGKFYRFEDKSAGFSRFAENCQCFVKRITWSCAKMGRTLDVGSGEYPRLV
ncbi:MAG TPA: hypothetical protein DD633_01145 [Sphaerochaeta sp.]|nr:hypothetical protein [Sphaerochaeta sp.]